MKIYRAARGNEGFKTEGEHRWRDRIEKDRKLKEKHCAVRQILRDGWQGNKEQSPATESEEEEER